MSSLAALTRRLNASIAYIDKIQEQKEDAHISELIRASLLWKLGRFVNDDEDVAEPIYTPAERAALERYRRRHCEGAKERLLAKLGSLPDEEDSITPR